MQNTSHAVMAQRVEAADSPDDFPTPPWATRGLIEHVLEDKTALRAMTCLEPACGAGHMAKVLNEYFGELRPDDLRRLHAMRRVSALREATWGFLQTGISSLDFDFLGYANDHLERFFADPNARTV